MAMVYGDPELALLAYLLIRLIVRPLTQYTNIDIVRGKRKYPSVNFIHDSSCNLQEP